MSVSRHIYAVHSSQFIHFVTKFLSFLDRIFIYSLFLVIISGRFIWRCRDPAVLNAAVNEWPATSMLTSISKFSRPLSLHLDRIYIADVHIFLNSEVLFRALSAVDCFSVSKIRAAFVVSRTIGIGCVTVM